MRKAGNYWVRTGMDWLIAEWSEAAPGWFIAGESGARPDGVWSEIDEREIVRDNPEPTVASERIRVELTMAQAKELRSTLSGEIERLWACPGVSRNDFLALDRIQEQRHGLEDILEAFDGAINVAKGESA